MRKLALLLVACCAMITHVWAQNRTVTGTVTDEGKNPVVGASIVVKGTTLGTTTNASGVYQISIPNNSRTLVLSGTGLGTREIDLTNATSTYDVSLGKSTSNLQEVVIVAYGTQKRANLTGSQATVGGAELENKPFSSLDKALQGAVSGLQSVSGTGVPGSNQNIRIRGVSSITAGNEPLYVIDGVQANSGDLSRLTTSANLLSTINPNDIESITVLKDAASAALYGARAGNGVILVTTKRGRAGKTRFRFDAENGHSDVAYVNDKYLPLNASQYINITREGLVNGGYSQATIDAQLTSLGNGNGTDFNWYDAVKQKGTQQQYNVSASGGNDKTTFFMSGGYFKQGATTIKTDFERINAAIRVTNKATDRLTLSLNLDGGFSRQNSPSNGGAFANPILSSFFILPTKSAYKPDGSYNILTADFPTSGTFNTLALANIDKRHLGELGVRGSISAEYLIIKNLRFKSNLGVDYNTIEEDQYNNPFYGDGAVLATGSPTFGPNVAYNGSSTGRAFAYYTRYFNYDWTNTLDYSHDITKNGDLKFSVLAGYEIQKSQGYLNSLQNTGFPPTLLIPYAAAAATPKTATNTISDYSFIGAFTSGNINYQDKYVITGSFRRDGSSRFGPNNKYGNFYSVGATWNVSKEAFMEKMDMVSQLKIRASYGKVGNASINNYDFFPGYGYGYNYNNSPGSAPNNVGDLDLTWEVNKPFDLGIDIGVLQNRINFTADYYKRKSEDLLLNVQLSRTSGFLSALRNLGSLQNEGIELSLNVVPVKTKSFTWTIDANFAHNTNKVLSLPEHKDIVNANNGNLLIREGYDVQSWYVRKYAGVDPANGDPLWYADSSGKITTNVYSSAQRNLYGSASPKYFGSVTNTFNFKGFTLDAQFYYNVGNYVQDAWGSYYVGAGFGATFNKVERVLDRWQKAGDVTDIPKYIYGGNKSFQSFSTFYLNKGDFIRLRNVQLGYTVPSSVLSKIKIASAFFYVRGTNLFTWVKDKNLPFDPEQGAYSQTNLNVFIPKTLTAGVNIGF